MKFSDLPLGAHFSFQGKNMVKHSPMLATDMQGGRQLVPRSARVRVEGPASANEPGADTGLDQYHAGTLELLREWGLLTPALHQALTDLHHTAGREPDT